MQVAAKTLPVIMRETIATRGMMLTVDVAYFDRGGRN
jgi:hypothetical protein